MAGSGPVRPDGLPAVPAMPALPRAGWPWRARLRRLLDADTLEVELDRGFRDTSVRRLRLAAVNAPERGTPAGRAAVEWVTEWLAARDATAAMSADLPPSRWPLLVLTVRPDAYGDRWDGWVWAVKDGLCLNQELLLSGHATPWPSPGASGPPPSLGPTSTGTVSGTTAAAVTVPNVGAAGAFAGEGEAAIAPRSATTSATSATGTVAAGTTAVPPSPPSPSPAASAARWGLPERLDTAFGSFLTAVVAAVDDFAEANNLPPVGLLAIGLQESGLDPEAVGDNGQSFGVFQIHLPAHGGAPETWTGLDGLARSMAEMRGRWVSTFAARGGWGAWVLNPQEFLRTWAPAAQGSVPWTSAIAAQRLGQAEVLLLRYLRLRLQAAGTAAVRDALDGLTLAAQGLDDLVARAQAVAAGCRAVVDRYR